MVLANAILLYAAEAYAVILQIEVGPLEIARFPDRNPVLIDRVRLQSVSVVRHSVGLVSWLQNELRRRIGHDVLPK